MTNSGTSGRSLEHLTALGSAYSAASRRCNELAALILQSTPGIGDLTDTTSLIKSGLLDSLGLVNVASFIEREVGHSVDLSAVDFALEWDTIAAIMQFIETLL